MVSCDKLVLCETIAFVLIGYASRLTQKAREYLMIFSDFIITRKCGGCRGKSAYFADAASILSAAPSR